MTLETMLKIQTSNKR